MESIQNIFNIIQEYIGNKDFSPVFFLILIGVLYILKVSWLIVTTLFQSTFCKLLSFIYQPNFRKKYGEWAVVTGSTDGIGKAYALELAKRNMNIVLISRSLQKLENTANEIQKQTRVQVKVIQADFTHGFQVFSKIEEELKDLDVGILVNNVGIAAPHPTFRKFDATDKQHLYNEILVNNGAPSQMTRLILPHMKQKRRGMIVFVGSIVSCFKCAYFANYSGTKAFVNHFVRVLDCEIVQHNIGTQLLIPSITDTNLSRGDHFLFKMSGGFIRSVVYPTARTYASWAICTLGYCSTAPGYWFFDLTILLVYLGETLRVLVPLEIFVMKRVFGRKVIN